jgi:hypothetical protein
VITERKSALRRKREISAEIDYIRSLWSRQTILATAIPFADKHMAALQTEFSDLENRFPASTKRRAPPWPRATALPGISSTTLADPG